MKRSKFDLSFERKYTGKANGTLYPVMCEAVLPGDRFNLNTETLARCTPLINPVYHRFDVTTHFFYVPNRLVWEDWTKFIFPETVQDDGNYALPRVSIIPGEIASDNGVPQVWLKEGTLADFLGAGIPSLIPLSNQSILDINLLPFLCYQKIWNEWYRDEDLQEKVVDNTDGLGLVSSEGYEQIFQLRKRCWEKDYFTSARPYPQKGTAAVVSATSVDRLTGNNVVGSVIGLNTGDGYDVEIMADGSLSVGSTPHPEDQGQTVRIESGAQFTIEEFRYANAVQRFLEKLQRYGSRYVEAIRGIFGVTVPDFRLQRPEYLGGGKQPLVISEVLQQAQDAELPLGTFAGHGISSGKAGFNYLFPEHGYVIGLQSIMPRANYINCIRKDFFKTDRFDYFFPQFANLGEQEIINAELAHAIDDPHAAMAFGYTERYGEYKFIPSTTHGLFRTDVNLRNFHADRAGDDYVLNGDFVQVTNTDDVERIFALDAVNYDPFLITVMHNLQAIRPVPMRQKPALE